MSGTGLYYWKSGKKPNFGDLMNELIADRIFAAKPHFEQFDSCDMIALGSLMDMLLSDTELGNKERKIREKADGNKPVHVWGTGLIRDIDASVNKPVRPLIIHALRGELTRQKLSAITGEEISCILADPGLLASRLVPAGEKEWDVGIIPHYVDKEDPVFGRLAGCYQNSRIIDVMRDPVTVITEISKCRYILSTSLHGIIVADSFGIPNCPCIASEKVIGGGFKFRDYFSSFDSDRQLFDLRNGGTPDIGADFATTYEDRRILQAKTESLLNVFPYELNTDFVPAGERTFFTSAGDGGTDISFAIPVYNARRYITECLDSIRAESEDLRVEIIASDDGSSDGSLEVMAGYASRYGKDIPITILTSKNRGVSAARNAAIHAARGRYVRFIDCDDTLCRGTSKIMFDMAEENGLCLLNTDARSFVDGEGLEEKGEFFASFYERKNQYPASTDSRTLFRLMFDNDEFRSSPGTHMLRRDLLTEYDLRFAEGILHEDELFMFEAYLTGCRAGHAALAGFNRRVRNNSIMTVKVSGDHVFGYFIGWKRMRELLAVSDVGGEERECFEKQCRKILNSCRNRYHKISKKEQGFYKELPFEERTLFEAAVADYEKMRNSEARAKGESVKLRKDVEKKTKEIRDIRNSVSFKIGRVLTWLPRKIKGMIR